MTIIHTANIGSYFCCSWQAYWPRRNR